MIDMSVVADKDYVPTLFDVHKFLDQSIVGEFHSRMSIFTAWILAEKYVMISGGSRSGKTWCKDIIKKLVKGQYFTIKPGSAKSGWRDAKAIQGCKYVDIPELNKIPLDMAEALKDWGEQKDAIYKTRDYLSGKWTTYKLPYRPFVFCIADENAFKVPEELQYRLVEVRMDSSSQQNRKVMMHIANGVKLPVNTKKIPQVHSDKLVNHIKLLPPFIQYDFRHPAADMLVDAVPDRFADCRTAFPIYLDNSFGIQRFLWKGALTGKVTGVSKPVMFVSPQAMWLNHYIFGTILINSSLKCSDIQKRVLEMIQQSNGYVDRKFIQKGLSKLGVNLSGKMVTTHLNKLADIGYLDKAESGSTKTYTMSEFFENFKFNLDWKAICTHSANTMKEHYPEYADEYIEKYCKNPTVQHPFTGDIINLNELTRVTKEMNNLDLYGKKKDVGAKEVSIIEEVVLDEKEEVSKYFKGHKNSVNAAEFEDKFGVTLAKKLLTEGDILEMPKGTYMKC